MNYRSLLIILLLLYSGNAIAGFPPKASSTLIIGQAGNTENEQERYQLLLGLYESLSPSDPFYADLGNLLPVIDHWANGLEKYWQPGETPIPIVDEAGYLSDFFALKAWPDILGPDGWVYPPRILPESELYPIWCLYRGRMLIWQAIQTGSFAKDEDTREMFFGQGRDLLQVAATEFPQNRVIGMYLDQPIPWPDQNPDHPDAPSWANVQREVLGKLADIIDFWIEERQAPDGQFGGGWGDDVEMWRWWAPILVGFLDPDLNDAQRLFSEEMFNLPSMTGGYTNQMTDVEHSAENTGDVITAMLHVAPDDPIWSQRAFDLADLMQNLWTGTNDLGFMQFKSTYFTSESVLAEPRFACDTAYHTRVVQPLLLVWQRTGDESLGELLSSWMDTRVDGTDREDQGKPAGVIPIAIEWPDGETGGPSGKWWDPGCALNSGAFEYPSAMSPLTRALLLVAWMIGDESYLEPVHSMAELRREYLTDLPEDPEKGSVMWAAKKMGFLSDVLAKYRLLYGSDDYDDLLLDDSNGYVRYRLTGDDAELIDALRELEDAFSVNWEGYTSETRWTDRVMAFQKNYANYYSEPPLEKPSTDILYSMITGDFGDPLYLPLNAVRWLTEPRDIAIMVQAQSTEGLTAELFSFDENDRPMGAEFHLLKAGVYTWSLNCEGNEVASGESIKGDTRALTEFTLPSESLCTFEIEWAEELPSDDDDNADDDDDEIETSDDDSSDDDQGCGCF